MSPQVAARRLAIALLLGAALGIFYGFLRPLGRRVVLRDSLFLARWSLAWLELGFGICAGDLRLGYLVAMAAGAAGWERLFGRALDPIFSIFWKFIRATAQLLALPMKKISHFAKILFASGEKWGTIVRSSRRRRPTNSGGKTHDRTLAKNGLEGAAAPVVTGAESGPDPADRICHRRTGRRVSGTPGHPKADGASAPGGRRRGVHQLPAGEPNRLP